MVVEWRGLRGGVGVVIVVVVVVVVIVGRVVTPVNAVAGRARDGAGGRSCD